MVAGKGTEMGLKLVASTDTRTVAGWKTKAVVETGLVNIFLQPNNLQLDSFSSSSQKHSHAQKSIKQISWLK